MNDPIAIIVVSFALLSLGIFCVGLACLVEAVVKVGVVHAIIRASVNLFKESSE